jgi:hypothetical protein
MRVVSPHGNAVLASRLKASSSLMLRSFRICPRCRSERHSSSKGLFFGYEFEPGIKWKGNYIIAPLAQFKGKTVDNSFRPKLIVVKEVYLPIDGKVIFPLKEAHEAAENSIVLSKSIYDDEQVFGDEYEEGEYVATVDDTMSQVVDKPSPGPSSSSSSIFDVKDDKRNIIVSVDGEIVKAQVVGAAEGENLELQAKEKGSILMDGILVPGVVDAKIYKPAFRDGSILHISGVPVRSNMSTTRPPHLDPVTWQAFGTKRKQEAVARAIKEGRYWADYCPPAPGGASINAVAATVLSHTNDLPVDMQIAMAAVDPEWHMFCLDSGLTLDGDMILSSESASSLRANDMLRLAGRER